MTRRGAYSHQSEIPASDNRIEEPGLTERAVQFRRFVDERMASQGIASLVELADISDVGRDTLYAWFRGRTPTPRAGGRVARSLGVSYRELLDAFERIERGEASEDLASIIAANTAAVTALAMELRNLLPHEIQGRLAHLEAAATDREGRLRSLEAQVATLLTLQGVATHGGRRLPRETAE